ncbi:MAG TPA: hypothetical protein DIU15_20845 [Deltaproteobacteria bacterium]|nr:hypothetical protein [Deltaproteobacteria bacterium]HCP48498.1 hypothetical protein [Deltaproteobacteria bacterium]
MTRPELPLAVWCGPCPEADYFGGTGPVLWLSSGPGASWLSPLKESLQEQRRLWQPKCSIVAVSDPLPGRSPWAWRPDQELPTRWSGDDSEAAREGLEHRLGDVRGCPTRLVGAVLDGVLESLGSHAARVVCEQAAEVLPEDCPYLLLEPNGGSLRQILGGYRSRAGSVGARQGNVRTATELRRTLELAGLGISAVSLLPSEGRLGRIGQRLVGSAASPQLVVQGRRI